MFNSFHGDTVKDYRAWVGFGFQSPPIQGYQLCRKEKRGKGQSGFEGEMVVEYAFEGVDPGTEVTIACRVQDDLGGEGMKMTKMEVH